MIADRRMPVRVPVRVSDPAAVLVSGAAFFVFPSSTQGTVADNAAIIPHDI